MKVSNVFDIILSKYGADAEGTDVMPEYPGITESEAEPEALALCCASPRAMNVVNVSSASESENGNASDSDMLPSYPDDSDAESQTDHIATVDLELVDLLSDNEVDITDMYCPPEVRTPTAPEAPDFLAKFVAKSSPQALQLPQVVPKDLEHFVEKSSPQALPLPQVVPEDLEKFVEKSSPQALPLSQVVPDELPNNVPLHSPEVKTSKKRTLPCTDETETQCQKDDVHNGQPEFLESSLRASARHASLPVDAKQQHRRRISTKKRISVSAVSPENEPTPVHSECAPQKSPVHSIPAKPIGPKPRKRRDVHKDETAVAGSNIRMIVRIEIEIQIWRVEFKAPGAQPKAIICNRAGHFNSPLIAEQFTQWCLDRANQGADKKALLDAKKMLLRTGTTTLCGHTFAQ